jgi:hypothetical protein
MNKVAILGFLVSVAVPRIAGADSDILHFNGHLYQRIDQAMKWTGAQALCKSKQAHLVTITSQAEDAFVADKLVIPGQHLAWLGATDASSEGQWKWVTGETWQYTDWDGGEPNNSCGGEDYLMMYSSNSPRVRKWNDESVNGSCSNYGLMYPVCEWDKGQAAELNVTTISSNYLQLSWDNTSNPKAYRLQRKQGGCGSSAAWSTLVDLSAAHAEFRDAKLKPGAAYAYRLAAYYGGTSFSSYSACAAATTAAAGTPNMPGGMDWPFPGKTSAMSRSDAQVMLAWNDNSDDEASFAIWRKAGAGEWAQIDTAPANAQGYTDDGAAGNRDTTRYSYDVRACNAKGCSAANPLSVPFAPTGLAASVGQSVKLTWHDASDNESGFAVFRKNGNCQSTKPWAWLDKSLPANTESYADASAVSKQVYSYKVWAFYDSAIAPDTRGYSGFSGCVSATTP